MRRLILFSIILVSSFTFAVSEQMMAFLDGESDRSRSTGYNFELKEIEIPHLEFEIGNDKLWVANNLHEWDFGADQGIHGIIVDLGPNLPQFIRNIMLFEKNGKKFVRYFGHPADTRYLRVIEEYLKERDIPFEKKTEFKGFRTASRSLIIIDPNSGQTFSLKPSTNSTGHSNSDNRVYPVRWIDMNRRLNDYFWKMREHLKYLDIAWEAAGVGFPPTKNDSGTIKDTGYSIRLMEDVSQGKTIHLSGFVLNEQKKINMILAKSGLSQEELEEKLQLAYGRAMAELTLILGYKYTSEHEQNIRFEFDNNLIPTGRAILLDLSDGKPIRDIWELNGEKEFLDVWHEKVGGSNRIDSLAGTVRSEFVWYSGSRVKVTGGKAGQAFVDRAAEILQMDPTSEAFTSLVSPSGIKGQSDENNKLIPYLQKALHGSGCQFTSILKTRGYY